MSFIESYKMLEKLCCEIYGTNRGVSSYIEDMESKPDGIYLVSGWSDDIYCLIRCRHVRNVISHEPGANEDNTCEGWQEPYIRSFYRRIMESNDPLAQYRRLNQTAERPRADVSAKAQVETPTEASAEAPIETPTKAATEVQPKPTRVAIDTHREPPRTAHTPKSVPKPKESLRYSDFDRLNTPRRSPFISFMRFFASLAAVTALLYALLVTLSKL